MKFSFEAKSFYMDCNNKSAFYWSNYHTMWQYGNSKPVNNSIYQGSGACGFPDRGNRKSCCFNYPFKDISCAASMLTKKKILLTKFFNRKQLSRIEATVCRADNSQTVFHIFL